MFDMDKFLGSFNKAKNLIEWQELNNECGFQIVFDENSYNRAGQDIEKTIGCKQVYTVKDVVNYFRKRFFAYIINLCDYYDYMGDDIVCQTSLERKRHSLSTDNIGALLDETGHNYCYIAQEDGTPSQEKNVTLVIPMSYCEELWARYHYVTQEWDKDIARHQEHCKKYNLDEPYLGGVYENIILVVGSFDGHTINSIKVVLQFGLVDDVEYAIAYFRTHS